MMLQVDCMLLFLMFRTDVGERVELGLVLLNHRFLLVQILHKTFLIFSKTLNIKAAPVSPEPAEFCLVLLFSCYLLPSRSWFLPL